MVEAPLDSLATGAETPALVLAAGRSERFGDENKLLSNWQGRSLLDHVLDSLAQSECSATLVITGSDHERVEARLRERRPPVPWLRHSGYESGMAGSLGRGIAALQRHEAVIVCLADMPAILPGTINALLRASGTSPEALFVVPVRGGRRGNPVVIRQALFKDVLALRGDVGARILAERRPERVLEVPVDDDAVLLDVDRSADIAKLP